MHIRHTTNEVTLYCLSLSLSRIAKRVVELGQLPPREILSILHHPLPNIHTFSTYMGHTIHSIPSPGSILSSARMREGVELCHSPPKRFSPPVVHNQESPLVSSCASCECASGLYSTQGTSTPSNPLLAVGVPRRVLGAPPARCA